MTSYGVAKSRHVQTPCRDIACGDQRYLQEEKIHGRDECVATIREAQALSISSILFTVTNMDSVGNAIGKIN